MKANTLTNVCSWASKLTMTCALAVGSFAYAQAQEVQPQKVLYFEEQDVVVGQDNTLSLMMNNPTESVSAMDFIFYLPNNVELSTGDVTSSFIVNPANVEGLNVTPSLDEKSSHQIPDYKAYKVLFLPKDITKLTVIPQGENLKLADLKIKVNPLKETDQIMFRNVTFSDATGTRLYTDPAKYVKAADFKLVAAAAFMSTDLAEYRVYDSVKTVLPLNLRLHKPINAAQFNIKVPANFEALTAESIHLNSKLVKAGYVVSLKEVFVTESERVYKVLTYTSEAKPISLNGYYDAFWSVDLTPVQKGAAGDVVISDILYSGVPTEGSTDVPGYYSKQNVVVKTKNATEECAGAKDKLVAQVDAYQNMFNASVLMHNADEFVAEKDAALNAIAELRISVEDMQFVTPETTLDQNLVNQVVATLSPYNFLALDNALLNLHAAILDTKAVDPEMNLHASAYMRLEKKLDPIERNLVKSDEAKELANESVFNKYVADINAVESELFKKTDEYNGAAFNAALAVSFDGKDLIDAAFDAKNYIEEDSVTLASARAALVEKYAALSAKHNAFLDMVTIEDLNVELEGLRGQLKEFVAVPGVVNPNNHTGQPSVADVSTLINIVLTSEQLETENPLEYKRMLKRGDVDNDGVLSLKDVNELINGILSPAL